MSHQGELVARPAGRSMGTSWPWKRMVGETRRRVRSAWRRTRERFPPAESPAKMILLAEMGSWRDLGGGWMRERYATRASTRAEGNGCSGARRYRTEKTGAPVYLENCATGTRCVHGSIMLLEKAMNVSVV